MHGVLGTFTVYRSMAFWVKFPCEMSRILSKPNMYIQSGMMRSNFTSHTHSQTHRNIEMFIVRQFFDIDFIRNSRSY